MAINQNMFRITMPLLQLLLGGGALFLLLLAMTQQQGQWVLAAAITGALLNLLISIQIAHRDMLAGLFAALAFGGSALLLAILNMGVPKSFVFFVLVTFMAITPGMAGVWGVFMYRQQKRFRNDD